MTDQWVSDYGWTLAGAWVVLYVLDYSLTLVGARLYQAGAKDHFFFEHGYELNPFFQRVVARMQWWSPRFVILLILSTGYFVAIWLWLGRSDDGSPGTYEFVMGLALLLEVVICGRHLVNIYTFRFVRKSEGVEGRIVIAHWLSLRQAAAMAIAAAPPLILWAAIDDSWFAAGGAVGCVVIALRFFASSGRFRRAADLARSSRAA